MTGVVHISAACEGDVDEAVLTRLIRHVGAEVYAVHGKRGKAHLRQRMAGYAAAARHTPWTVLVDLDDEAPCGPSLADDWVPNPTRHLCFRAAVRTVEAWLLADRERLARFLGVSAQQLPVTPELVPDPKGTIVTLARRSSRSAIRQDMVPRPGSRRAVGPAYVSRVIEFASDAERGWRPEVAAKRAPSLAGLIACLRRLSSASHG